MNKIVIEKNSKKWIIKSLFVWKRNMIEYCYLFIIIGKLWIFNKKVR